MAAPLALLVVALAVSLAALAVATALRVLRWRCPGGPGQILQLLLLQNTGSPGGANGTALPACPDPPLLLLQSPAGQVPPLRFLENPDPPVPQRAKVYV